MAIKKMDRIPAKICGHSDVIYFTAQTNNAPPAKKRPMPTRRICQLVMVDAFRQSFIFPGDENEVTEIDDGTHTLAQNKYWVLLMDRIR